MAKNICFATWLYFRGLEQGNNILLNWATGAEINTDYFAVERSLNGTDFTKIGKVNAKHSGSNNYQYLDVKALN